MPKLAFLQALIIELGLYSPVYDEDTHAAEYPSLPNSMQVPPGGEKRHWRYYIFLWLFYVLFEETETKVSGVLHVCSIRS